MGLLRRERGPRRQPRANFSLEHRSISSPQGLGLGNFHFLCFGSKKQKGLRSCSTALPRVLKGVTQGLGRPVCARERPCAWCSGLGTPWILGGGRWRPSREADCGSRKEFLGSTSGDGHVTSFPSKRTFLGSRILSPLVVWGEGGWRQNRLCPSGRGGSPETLCTGVYCKSSRKSFLQSEGQRARTEENSSGKIRERKNDPQLDPRGFP